MPSPASPSRAHRVWQVPAFRRSMSCQSRTAPCRRRGRPARPGERSRGSPRDLLPGQRGATSSTSLRCGWYLQSPLYPRKFLSNRQLQARPRRPAAHNLGMKLRPLGIAMLFVAATLTAYAQAPAPVTPEALVTAAKRAAGSDYAGTFLRICVAPDNLNAGGPRGGGPGPRAVPDRATWYAKPYKVFDNLYFIGTRIHSAWALTTSAGIIVIDTLFDYAIEPEMVEGMTTLGLDPRDIKYVLISHAHGDHDQGAALLQSRYSAKIVMGAADWDATLQRTASAPGGVPKRDIEVGREGRKLTLGDTTVDVNATPVHTPGHCT